jgi:hypothetical protein
MGCGAYTSHTKKAMIRMMPRMRGTMLCGLPQTYYGILVDFLRFIRGDEVT